MSNRRSAWIDRRGQRGADAAIDQVIQRQPQAGEQIQQLADELIEDSPYQARQAFSTESVEELAQGMREAGFQGVLIVRPHSDPAKRRRGIVQLVYGHRRRIAWRQVCVERGSPCLVPTVIREVSDAQLLTIGAQENLQRQDLDPVEEAQIVAWHERMFFDKNQAQIGAMLGKSSDWVSVRSRVHKLPDVLKDCLRQRPRAIKQILELAALYPHQPQMALALAVRVVNERLSVDALRVIINRQAKNQDTLFAGDKRNNRRASATSVQDITIDLGTEIYDRTEEQLTDQLSPESENLSPDQTVLSSTSLDEGSTADTVNSRHLELVVEMLESLASQADEITSASKLFHQLEIAEQFFAQFRRAIVRRLLPSTVVSRAHAYRILNGELGDLVFMLRHHRVALVVLGPTQGKGQPLYLVICRLPAEASPAGSLRESGGLLVSIPGGSSAVVSTATVDLRHWTQRNLRLGQREAVMATALLQDLRAIFLEDAD